MTSNNSMDSSAKHWVGFFAAKHGDAAANIAGERLYFLDGHHLSTTSAGGGCELFEIQFIRDGKHGEHDVLPDRRGTAVF